MAGCPFPLKVINRLEWGWHIMHIYNPSKRGKTRGNVRYLNLKIFLVAIIVITTRNFELSDAFHTWYLARYNSRVTWFFLKIGRLSRLYRISTVQKLRIGQKKVFKFSFKYSTNDFSQLISWVESKFWMNKSELNFY